MCSILFGYLVSWFGNYDAPLIIIAAMVFASSLLFTQIDPNRPIFIDDKLSFAKEPECI